VLEVNNFDKLQSAFAWVRLWDGPVWLAYAAQAVVAVTALVAVVSTWRGDAAWRLKAALLLIGALLVSPYVVDYDFILLGMAAALFAAHALERGFLPWEKTFLAAAWLVPLLARTAARGLYLPLGLMVLIAMFALVARRVRAEPGRGVSFPVVGDLHGSTA
jgi:alpha-1,2-mannosyltransferase